jgi:uncharacterized protein with HXXEE motif
MALEQLCWLATVAYGIHIFEEYLLNWRDWARSISGVSVTSGFFFGMNALVIVLGMTCAELADRLPTLALSFPALMLINATFFHVGALLWTRARFSPGLITALLLFYPMGIWCFKSGQDAGLLTVARLLESFALGAMFMVTPIVLLRAREIVQSRKR